MTDAQLEQRVEECIQRFGKIDVLVNNAGYAIGGAFEDYPMETIRAQMEANFFGPVRMMKALIPHFRANGSGNIINVTSTEGIQCVPGITMYGSSKFALEGASEGLQGELAPFNIRVLLVEPGGMRTNFLDQNNVTELPRSAPYKDGIVDHVLHAVMGTAGQQMLDPDRTAKRIVEAIDGSGEGWPDNRGQYLRLPVGKEVIGRVNAKIESLKTNVDAMEKIWNSVDFDS